VVCGAPPQLVVIRGVPSLAPPSGVRGTLVAPSREGESGGVRWWHHGAVSAWALHGGTRRHELWYGVRCRLAWAGGQQAGGAGGRGDEPSLRRYTRRCRGRQRGGVGMVGTRTTPIRAGRSHNQGDVFVPPRHSGWPRFHSPLDAQNRRWRRRIHRVCWYTTMESCVWACSYWAAVRCAA
jgi:hypothetical protein